MDIQQFKYFLVLINEMNFTDAAEALYISQSALSKQIKALEREMNVILFDRTTRRISLTQAGQDFQVYAAQIVNTYDQMMANMAKHMSNIKHKLTIAATQQLTNYGLTDLILRFSEANPSIEVVITELEPRGIAKEVRAGTADMGILYCEYMQDLNFNYIPIYYDKLVLVAGKNHPLAQSDLVHIDQLRGETLLFIRSLDLDCKEIITLCAKHGFVPNISPSNLRLNSMERYITSGSCVSIMPQIQTRSFENPNMRFIELSEQVPRTLSFVIAKGKRSDEANAFIDYILKKLEK